MSRLRRESVSTFDRPASCGRRSGFTLIELLIVVLIVLVLTAISIPVVAPAVANRRTREASRELSTLVAATRDRAIATGRPAGIWIERVPEQPDMAFLISQCEVPPPFSGDSTQSRAAIGIVPPPGANGAFPRPIVCLPVEFDSTLQQWAPLPADAWDSVVRFGDLIKFNHQGHTFELRNAVVAGQKFWTIGQWTADANGDGRANPAELELFENHTANALLLPPLSNSMPPKHVFPFQITRQPKKGSGRPLQFPTNTVLDLSYSGDFDFGPFVARMGADIYQGQPALATNSTEIAIVFAPNGAVEHVYVQNGVSAMTCYHPTSQIYLLIGKRENIPLYSAPYGDAAGTPTFSLEDGEPKPNWLDPNSIWLTINPTTGLVTTSENLSPVETLDANDDGQIDASEYDVINHLKAARGFAAQSSSQGGR